MKFIPSLFVLLLAAQASYSQNIIYFEKDFKEGEIIEITSDKIKYKNPNNPGPVYSFSKSKALFALNNAGNYLLIANNDSCTSELTEFQRTASSSSDADKIFTSQSVRINCSITGEDDKYIQYISGKEKNKIEKSGVVLVIYKNGKHKMLTVDYGLTAGVLKKFQHQDLRHDVVVAAAPAKAPVPAAPAPSAPVPAVTTEKRAEYIDEVNGIAFSDYEKMALQKTGELSEYLRLLGNKSTSYDQANKAIDQACTLFINEDAVVELSSLGQKNILRFKIRDYFKRLKLLKYEKVDIEWAHIQYVSKLRKAPDGTYRGVITVEQTFSGFVENKVVYSDVTRKNIEVVLKTYNKSSEGKSKVMWDILLSDIKVVETKNS